MTETTVSIFDHPFWLPFLTCFAPLLLILFVFYWRKCYTLITTIVLAVSALSIWPIAAVFQGMSTFFLFIPNLLGPLDDYSINLVLYPFLVVLAISQYWVITYLFNVWQSVLRSTANRMRAAATAMAKTLWVAVAGWLWLATLIFSFVVSNAAHSTPSSDYSRKMRAVDFAFIAAPLSMVAPEGLRPYLKTLDQESDKSTREAREHRVMRAAFIAIEVQALLILLYVFWGDLAGFRIQPKILETEA